MTCDQRAGKDRAAMGKMGGTKVEVELRRDLVGAGIANHMGRVTILVG